MHDEPITFQKNTTTPLSRAIECYSQGNPLPLERYSTEQTTVNAHDLQQVAKLLSYNRAPIKDTLHIFTQIWRKSKHVKIISHLNYFWFANHSLHEREQFFNAYSKNMKTEQKKESLEQFIQEAIAYITGFNLATKDIYLKSVINYFDYLTKQDINYITKKLEITDQLLQQKDIFFNDHYFSQFLDKNFSISSRGIHAIWDTIAVIEKKFKNKLLPCTSKKIYGQNFRTHIKKVTSVGDYTKLNTQLVETPETKILVKI